MTKTFVKVTILCAAAALSASALAQSAPPNPKDATSVQTTPQTATTKHLTATGRMNEPTVRASRLVGAQVNDISGNRAGQIQDIVVNPHSGRIDFALLSLSGASANPNIAPNAARDLVPVPWSLLRTTATQYSLSSAQPVFTVNVDPIKLRGAPTVSTTDLDQSEWRQRIYSYYGVTPQSYMGGADSEQGEIKGQGARAPGGE